MDDLTNFARALRTQRKKVGFSQAALCSVIGADRRTYSNWEAGRYWPSAFWLPRLSDAFGCTIEELFLPAEAAVPGK